MVEQQVTFPEQGQNFASLIGRIAHGVDSRYSAGDVAALRRMSDGQPAPIAFWRIAETELGGVIPEAGPASTPLEHRWRAILTCAAVLKGLHAPNVRLGTGLARAGFSEARLERLLRARGAAVNDSAIATARFLASKGQSANLGDLALIILSDGRSDEDSVRRKTARAFFALESQTSGE